MKTLKRLIKRIPGAMFVAQLIKFFPALAKNRSLLTILFAPPGHFYSPLPNLSQTARPRSVTTRHTVTLPAIDLRMEQQLILLEAFAELHDDLTFPDAPTEGNRYHYENNYYGAGDAIILYCMMRHFKPSKIIEVGSGYSSAAMLDTANTKNIQPIEFTFIEPNPERLFGLLSPEDRQACKIVECPVQNLSIESFSLLQENDILFIDSSHVSKYGSDVNFLVYEVLPALNPRVLVHFHDILWPFEYPEAWVQQGISWNEAYLLRAFLCFNQEFEVLYFNSYIGCCHLDRLRIALPRASSHIGGSLWLRRK